MDGACVSVAFNGEGRGDDADLPGDAGLNGRPGPGPDDADYRHPERALCQGQGRGGGRVAGDDHELHVLGSEPGADLAHEGADLLGWAHAVGAALCVAHVEDGLVRQQRLDGARDGEAAHTRVEDADRGVFGCAAYVAATSRDVQGVRDAPPF